MMKKIMATLIVLLFSFSVTGTVFAESNHFSEAFYDEEQLIVVSVKKTNDTKATFQTYEKVNGAWKLALGPVPAVVGKGGVTENKKEGDGKTPVGIYELGTAFGSVPKLNEMNYSYRQTENNDYWIDDPSSNDYNKWIKYSGDPNKKWNSYEKMLQPLYKYGVHIRYNDNPIVKGKGSAIFLHTWRSESSPTAGCVAISEQNLKNVLLWLNESKKPKIVISKEDTLQQLLNQKTLSDVTNDLKRANELSSSLYKQYSLIQSREDLQITSIYINRYNELKAVSKKVNSRWSGLTSTQQQSLSNQYDYMNQMRTRTASHIDVMSRINKELLPDHEQLLTELKKGQLDENAVQAYDQLSQSIKKTEISIGKVYGSNIRHLLLDEFVVPAKIAKESIIYEVSIYRLLEQIEAQTDKTARELNLKKLDRLKARAKEIKEQGNKLYPGKYPAYVEINQALLQKENAIRENMVN